MGSGRGQRSVVTRCCLLFVPAGVKGQVFDSSGVPVQNAVVEVKGRNNMSPFRSDKHGEYYRLLLPGNYSFTVRRLILAFRVDPEAPSVLSCLYFCAKHVVQADTHFPL